MQERDDIRLIHDDVHFDVRVAGILIADDGRILVSHEATGEQTLPGGAVKYGEATATAVIREFKEETGLTVTPSRLCAVCENFFTFTSEHHQQLLFIYEVKLIGNKTRVVTPASERLTPTWTNPDKITKLLPSCLNELIGKIRADEGNVPFYFVNH